MATELMTTAAVAERLGVDVSTVARWVNAGRLPVAVKIPGLRGARLFDPKDVDALAEQHKEAS